MKRKLLTTSLLTMSLLSFNLSAAGKMKCVGGVCIVHLSKNSPSVKKKEVLKVPTVQESYKTVIIDNIETIVFSRYVMTENEIVDYDLEQMQKSLLSPILNTDLPNSDYLCEDNLKPVKVAGIANTYECT